MTHAVRCTPRQKRKGGKAKQEREESKGEEGEGEGSKSREEGKQQAEGIMNAHPVPKHILDQSALLM